MSLHLSNQAALYHDGMVDIKRDVSIVVPVYLNSETLVELNSRLLEALAKSNPDPEKYEVIYVVDGSPDNSIEILETLKKEAHINERNIRIIELSKNFGQTAALMAGFSNSEAKAIVAISADLQDPPEVVLDLIAAWQKGYDIVISTRESRIDSRLTILTSKIAHRIFRISEPDMPKNGFDLFLISRTAARQLVNIRGKSRFLQGDIMSLGFKRKIISHKRIQRKFGKSSYTFRTRCRLFLDSVFENTKFPITLIFSFGTIIGLLGIGLAVLSVLNYFSGGAPFSGFVAIFSSILILGGLQVFLLGVIGQFIYRSFEISRERPLYIIKRIL